MSPEVSCRNTKSVTAGFACTMSILAETAATQGETSSLHHCLVVWLHRLHPIPFLQYSFPCIHWGLLAGGMAYLRRCWIYQADTLCQN